MKMKSMNLVWIAGFMTLAMPAFAAETASNVSVETEGSASQSVLDDLYLSYLGTYHGPTLSHMDSPNTVDRTGKLSTTASMIFDSEAGLGYKFNSDLGAGVVVPFILAPTLGNGMTLGDVGIKAFNKKTISTSNFNLYTNLILQAPTNDYSEKRNMKFAVKTTPNVRYHVASSRFSFGAWTEAKAYMGVTADKTFKLYGAPYISYQLSPKLALNLLYEMEADHYYGKPTFDLTSYQTDLQPGVVWNITREVMVNPFVQIFTGNKVSADTTAVGAVISATLM